MRVQCISIEIAQCLCPELPIIEISYDSRFGNNHQRMNGLEVADLHVCEQPSFLELHEVPLIFFLLLLVLSTICNLKLHVVSREVKRMFRGNHLLECECGARYRLLVPFLCLRVFLVDVRIFLFIKNPVSGGIILPQKVSLRLHPSPQIVFRCHNSLCILPLIPNVVLHIAFRCHFPPRFLDKHLSVIQPTIHNPLIFLCFFFVNLNISM